MPHHSKLELYLEQQQLHGERYRQIEKIGPLVYNFAALMQPKQLLNRLEDLTKIF